LHRRYHRRPLFLLVEKKRRGRCRTACWLFLPDSWLFLAECWLLCWLFHGCYSQH